MYIVYDIDYQEIKRVETEKEAKKIVEERIKKRKFCSYAKEENFKEMKNSFLDKIFD